MKLKPHFETEIFINEPGYVAIRQPDSDGSGESQLVQLAPCQIPLVITALRELRDDADDWLGVDDAPKAAEITGRELDAQMRSFEAFLDSATAEQLARLSKRLKATRGEADAK